MSKPIRRVVTGHDAQGRSVFIMDGPAPTVHARNTGSAVCTELWETTSMPADNSGHADPTAHPYRLPPQANGTVFRVIEYPPDRIRLAAMNQQQPASAGIDGNPQHYHGTSRHPGFHKIDSVDYAIVLQGEIWALMDEGETLLRQGDILIQRGTNHAWSNRTEQPAYVAFVLIDAKPA
jgi:hypothetical protein